MKTQIVSCGDHSYLWQPWPRTTPDHGPANPMRSWPALGKKPRKKSQEFNPSKKRKDQQKIRKDLKGSWNEKVLLACLFSDTKFGFKLLALWLGDIDVKAGYKLPGFGKQAIPWPWTSEKQPFLRATSVIVSGIDGQLSELVIMINEYNLICCMLDDVGFELILFYAYCACRISHSFLQY